MIAILIFHIRKVNVCHYRCVIVLVRSMVDRQQKFSAFSMIYNIFILFGGYLKYTGTSGLSAKENSKPEAKSTCLGHRTCGLFR